MNRKTEYALLALEHMARKEKRTEAITSTREVSESYRIPYPLLAKVMQTLSGKGLIKSVHGTKGGYQLIRRTRDIRVVDVIQIFDGTVAVADCFKEEKITCPQWDGCLIKTPFYELNRKILDLLSETSIADLAIDRENEGATAQGMPV
ncbi:MAG: Rrf2 family transcriptional regulator [Deltaproteobacteria bacterium]|nr:Rrf2 family transcriptional regulator [Deltaproteobacteria bacterium]